MIVGPSRNELSLEGLIHDDVWEIDTWPYNPSGTLRQALQAKHMSTDEILKLQGEEYKQLNDFVQQFSEKQKTSIGWILAATVGVLGNLAVTLGFGPLTSNGNLAAMFLVLLIILILVFAYFLFLQKVSTIFRFIGPYVSFPSGYEQHIQQNKCVNPYSQIILQFNNLSEATTNFGTLVRTALLKKYLKPILDKSSSIKISDIRDVGGNLGFYFIEISLKNIWIWLNPHGKENTQRELRNIVDTLLQARITCSVYSFEVEPQEWIRRGPKFVDTVSTWKMDELQATIIGQLQPKPSKSTLVYRELTKAANWLKKPYRQSTTTS
jgi:flagellar basal body-associated protein FliL